VSMKPPALGLVFLAVLLAAADGHLAVAENADPEERLALQGFLKPGDRAHLDRGDIVTKMLDAENKSEIRTLVVLHVPASEGQFLACLKDPQCMKRAGDMVGAGLLPDKPATDDLRGVGLDKRELGVLSHCQVNHCDIRLSAEDIERFRKDIPWTTPESRTKAEELFRELVAGYATSYRSGGDEVLPTYSNNPHPIRVHDSLHDLMATSLPVLDQVPELLRYVHDFPASSLKPIDQFLYWYKERMWRETVIAVNHVVIYERNDKDAKRLFTVSKQIFASNYYDSSLEVAEFYRPEGADHSTLVFLGASRMDVGRPEGFNFFERLIIHHLVPRGLQSWFTSVRERMKQMAPQSAALQ
jgi:hypothetical protein